MENLAILNTETALISGNEQKGEVMENGCSIGNTSRKGLSDITNLQQQPSLGAKLLLHPASLRSKNCIDKLQQENMTLMKVLAERNKVIELSGIELQKLRINLEKFQQQNLVLAQANSQILVELNSGKDKLKALKHELGCKNAVLKAIKKEKRAKNGGCATSGNECAKAGESLKEEDGEDNPSNGESLKEEDGENQARKMNRRRQSKKLCPSNIKPVPAKEGVDNKRACLRRQSDRCKPREPEVTQDVFEVDDTKFFVSSSCDDKVHKSGPTSSGSSVNSKHEEGCIVPRNEAQELRTSMGRPLRRAVEKVQSYKEIPLTVKMRREE
ncbi:hypothetical protein DITRI_Ditri12bG0094600 [Diplodiscus trichospermus]